MDIYTPETKHFVYKTFSTSGLFYIGRHSTKNLNDGYQGSGKWVQLIKDKNELETIILEFANSFEELLILEQKYIDQYFQDNLCMNFQKSSMGFAPGEDNIGTKAIAKRVKDGTWHLQKGDIQRRTNLKLAQEGRCGFQRDYIMKAANEIRDKVIQERVKNGTWILQDVEFHKKHVAEQIKNGQHCSQIKKECEHCHMIVDSANYGRSHGKKCPVYTGHKIKVKKHKKKVLTCSNCGKTMSSSNFKKYNHGANCKKLK